MSFPPRVGIGETHFGNIATNVQISVVFWCIAAVIRRVKDRVQWGITLFGSFFIVSTLNEHTSARDGSPPGAVGRGTSGVVSAAGSGRAVGGNSITDAGQMDG